MKLKTLLLAAAPLLLLNACHSKLDELINGKDSDNEVVSGPTIPPNPPPPPPDNGKVKPAYDQATATPAQDLAFVKIVIGQNYLVYAKEPWIVDRLNGINNLGAGARPYSSLLVDAWKALARLGLIDVTKLLHPENLRSNDYPVPVRQEYLP